MELLKLSKFKLQLRALISEVHELKEKERNASQHLQHTFQKQKRIEEEFNKKLADLRAELGFSNDRRHKLERKVTCLENENNLLENKQKELEGTIQGLLESKEAFVKAYEEASSIKKLMDDARHALRQKEDVEKINNLESKLMNNEVELTTKTKRIRELEAELEAAILSKEFQPRIMQFQRDVSTKELLLQNLISENKGLLSEVGRLSIVIKKIQDAVTCMSEEDRKKFTSPEEGQEECQSIRQSENLRMPDIVQTTRKDSLKSSMIEESIVLTRMQKFTDTLHLLKEASPEVQEDSIKSPLKKDNKINCYASESVYSPSPSACSVRQRHTDNASVSAAAAKDD